MKEQRENKHLAKKPERVSRPANRHLAPKREVRPAEEKRRLRARREETPAEEERVLTAAEEAPAESTPTAENEKPVRAEKAPTAEDEKPVRRKKAQTAEDEKPVRRKKAPTAEDEKPVRRKKAPTAEDEKPVRRKKAQTAENEKPVRRKKASAEENEKAEGKNKKKRSVSSRILRAVVIAGLIVLIVLAGFVSLVIYGANKVASSEEIFPNVRANNVELGELTRDAALQKLRESGWNEAVGGTLHVTLPMEVSVDLDYIEAGACLTDEQILELAWKVGREGNAIDNLLTYVDCRRESTDVSNAPIELNDAYIEEKVKEGVNAFAEATADRGHYLEEKESKLVLVKGAGQMRLNEEELTGEIRQALTEHKLELDYQKFETGKRMPNFAAIYKELTSEVKNAHYDPATDTIEPEVVGVDFDVETAEALWKKAQPGEKIVIPVTIEYPTVTAEKMKEVLFRDLLGERSTSFWGSSDNRIGNIELVAQKLDGLVIQPGEEFSYNGFVGERTAEAGFRAADAYVNGQVKPEIGGGICQVSSTLYVATLSAQLEITDRTCHMFQVGYLPTGLDATVSWPGPDFKFVNNRDYPVRLSAKADREEKTLTIQVWGSNIDGTYAVPGSSWAGERYDEKWKEKGVNVLIGRYATSWLDIFDADGNQLEHRQGFRSYYALHDEDIQWPEDEPEEEVPADPKPKDGDGDDGGGSGGGDDGGDDGGEVVIG